MKKIHNQHLLCLFEIDTANLSLFQIKVFYLNQMQMQMSPGPKLALAWTRWGVQGILPVWGVCWLRFGYGLGGHRHRPRDATWFVRRNVSRPHFSFGLHASAEGCWLRALFSPFHQTISVL
jgi:hypothetical protein